VGLLVHVLGVPVYAIGIAYADRLGRSRHRPCEDVLRRPQRELVGVGLRNTKERGVVVHRVSLTTLPNTVQGGIIRATIRRDEIRPEEDGTAHG
jgi:hypothetical protein